MLTIFEDLKMLISSHLNCLEENFNKYFPNEEVKKQEEMHWILYHFSTKSLTLANADLMEPLIEIRTDIPMNNIFQTFDDNRARFGFMFRKKAKWRYFPKRQSKLTTHFLASHT